MAIKYNDVQFKFNREKELDIDKEFKLRFYAVAYLHHMNELNYRGNYLIRDYFEINPWRIRVDVKRMVLGIVKTKSYLFDLNANMVGQVVQDKNSNDYIIKRIISNSFYQQSFLEFVANNLKDQAKEYGITTIEQEYDIYPGAIS